MEREIDRKGEAETLVNTVIVAVQEFQQTKSEKNSPSHRGVEHLAPTDRESEALNDAISSIIHIYSQI